MFVSGFFSVGSLVKLVAFLSSLHWPSEFHDLGPGGTLPPETCAVVFLEGLISLCSYSFWLVELFFKQLNGCSF